MMESKSDPALMKNRFRRRVVLIVDDEPDVLELLSDALEDVPASLILAGTAEEALQAVEHYIIDLAIIDVFMPGKGGLWLIEALHEQNPEAEIAIMSGGWTGMEADKAVRAAQMIGVRHTFTKPFDLAAIESFVAGVVSAD